MVTLPPAATMGWGHQVVLASEVLYDCREAQDVAVAALRLMGGGQAHTLCGAGKGWSSGVPKVSSISYVVTTELLRLILVL